MSNINWISIQPLTGGMYIGTRNAVGCPAKYILSYPTFNEAKYDKEGNVVSASNEFNLIEYLKKHNEMPPYYVFNRTAFQNDTNLDVTLTQLEGEETPVEYENIDLVTAVPVCSGLSMSTIASSEIKETRNCNMLWIALYTLNVIKPKVYIFENAPTLVGNPGAPIREKLEKIASDAGYSIVYYKTDTQLHDNCQKRPRTFIYFFKHRNGESFIPQLGYENMPVNIDDFFNRIPEDATQKIAMPYSMWVQLPLDYIQYLHGDNWQNVVKDGDIWKDVTASDKETDKLRKWLQEYRTTKEIEAVEKYLDHIDKKVAQGKGWWVASPKHYNNIIPTCMHRNVFSALHYKENRLYNMREWIHSMGLPSDFEMYGSPINYYYKIGQNVPARTAQFIVSEAIKVINNWENEESIDAENTNKAFFDNIKQKRVW